MNVSTALTKSASALSALGNTSAETIGLVTGATEQLTGQATKVAKGLQSIGINIANAAQESDTLSVAVGNTTKEINLLGESGDTLSTFDVLQQIAEYWDEMTNAQQTAIASSLAGKTRFDVFAATMNGFEDAIDASTTALNSQGSAWEENDKRAESLTAKLKGLNAEFVDFVTTDGVIKNLLATFIDLGTTVLEFANTDMGQLVTAIGLVAGGFATLKAFGIADLFIRFSSAVGIATNSTLGLGAALEFLNINPIFLAITAVVGLVAAYDALTTSVSEANDNLEKLNTEYTQTESSINSLEEQLSTIHQQIKDINTEGGADVAQDGELETLVAQSTELENQIALLEEKQRLNQAESEKSAQKAVSGKTFYDVYSGGEDNQFDYSVYGTQVEALKEYSEVMSELSIKIQELEQEQNDLIVSGQTTSEQYSENNDELIKLQEAYDKNSTSAMEFKDALDTVIESTAEDSETRAEAQSGIDAYISVIKDSSDQTEENTSANEENQISLEDLAESYELSADAIQAYADANDISIEAAAQALSDQEDIKQALEDTADAYDEARSQLTALPDAYDTLNSAMNEYNSIGRLNADTLDNLLSLGDEYLSLLSFENGQMSINEAGMQALANSKIDDAEATAVQEAQAKLAAIANGTYNDTLVETSAASSVAVSAAQNAGVAIINSGNDAQTAAALWADAWNTISQQYTMSTTEQKQQSAQVSASLKTQITAYEGVRSSLGSYTKSTQSAAKATGSATKAVDANTAALQAQKKALQDRISALQDEVSDYETATSYIDNLYDEKINKLQEKEDKLLEKIEDKKEKVKAIYEEEVEAIEDKIDSLEDAADADDKYYDNLIDNLEEEKDVQINAIKEQIDAIKNIQEERSDYWKKQIDALEAANQAVEDQITLQDKLENLAKAQSTKVLVMGEDEKFHYISDTSAVDEAQAELDEYKREMQFREALQALQDKKDEEDAIYEAEIESLQEKEELLESQYDLEIENLENLQQAKKDSYDQQIADLQDQRDALEEIYNQQIEDLDKQTEKIKAKYDAQIEKVEQYKEAFDKMVSSYKDNQDKLLAEQLTGIKLEGKNWDKRLSNLQSFADAYASKLQELADLQAQLNDLNASISVSTGGGTTGGGGGGGTTINGYQIVDSSGHVVKQFSTEEEANAYMNKIATSYALTKGLTLSVEAYASGVSSINDDQVALVGDNPSNQELILGSKANGSLMNLKAGSGVVNAQSTKTLAGILNALKDSSITKGMAGIVSNTTNPNINNSNFNMNIQNLNIEANNPDEFETWARLTQSAYMN